MNGVLIIAKKHRLYARMALNLVASIKASDPGIPVVLIHDDCINDYTEVEKFQFYKLIRNDNPNPFEVKLSLFDLSPFEKTVYLDADTLLLPNKSLTQLFALKGFHIANRGYTEANDWLNVAEAIKKYKTKQWLNTSSEVIVFDKSCAKVFESAKEFYAADTINRKIGMNQPDEPAFSYAIEVNKIKLTTPWLPSFWDGQEKYKSEHQILSEYTILSMGGNQVSDRIRSIYNRFSTVYASKVGLRAYPHTNKSELKERTFV